MAYWQQEDGVTTPKWARVGIADNTSAPLWYLVIPGGSLGW
jgi:hypothetical protein